VGAVPQDASARNRDAALNAASDPSVWFLPPTPNALGDACGVWGCSTDMAARAVPWDENCAVSPLIGGFDTMNSIRTSFENAIREAEAAGTPPGRRGCVYVAGWRINPLRDLSAGNAWRGSNWTATQTATTDDTAVGLFLRLLEAGVSLRMLLWLPHSLQRGIAMTKETAQEHYYLLTLIRTKSDDLEAKGFPPGLGVVALDTRVGAFAGSHHQKMIVVRGAGATHVAYCGGVDLAFTRRDAPAGSSSDGSPRVHDGDWQSGASLPGGEAPAFTSGQWPKQPGIVYPSIADGAVTKGRSITTDLPYEAYGRTNQIWHDQHLKLEGNIVLTLEQQFRERWIDPAPGSYAVLAPAKRGSAFRPNAVYVSHPCVIEHIGGSSVLGPLPPPAPLPARAKTGSSRVQMWRTIPVRERGSASNLCARGEFSNLAGIAQACSRASELIWMFEQYLWSRPLCALLNKALADPARPRLHVIVVLPPFPDGQEVTVIGARRKAFADLANGLTPAQLARVRVYTMWHPSRATGIYVHAKMQMYDGSLLVCGSCNLNQRSFLCDTELNCAVLDTSVVRDHQRSLWRLLFPQARGIEEQLGSSLDLNASGSGRLFFDAFVHAATRASFLVEDPDFFALHDPTGTPVLPSNWPSRPPRERTPLQFRIPVFLLDPSSLPTAFPPPAAGGSAVADLLEISTCLSEDSASKPLWRK
jgi:phosphatidylserine/phosphatidylglycerophosphate/cardiolipin synthase-like enzyme